MHYQLCICIFFQILYLFIFLKPLITTRFLIREISFHTTNSHEIIDVVDVGRVPVLELFISGHLYHLILLRSNALAVAVLAVVVVVAFRQYLLLMRLSYLMALLAYSSASSLAPRSLDLA